MYLEHFKFRQFPFALTPNTHFYCDLNGYQAALNVLLVSLANGEGFIKIIGEVGTGKTLLCRKLLSQLDSSFVTAYILNPDLTSLGLRRAFAQEIGIDVSHHMDAQRILELITQKLLELNAADKKVILVIDEAQALPVECLESIRLLTNLETETTKLLHVVLFAQPELDTRLEQPELRQLKQRISFSHYISPLTRSDLNAYLSHRLVTAGFTHGALFERKACDLLYRASQGIPRVINILCHKALLSAYGQGCPVVTPEAMRRAIQDSNQMVKPRFIDSIYTKWIAAIVAASSLGAVLLKSLS